MACACSMPGLMGMTMMDACTCGKGMGCTCGAMGMMAGGMMMGGTMKPLMCMYMLDDKTCCCCLMMAGCKKEDIQCMMMADGMMMCMGKMTKPEQLKGDGMTMMKEFSWGMYERKVPCPMGTKMDDCKVMCMDGMCMITIPCGKMLKPE